MVKRFFKASAFTGFELSLVSHQHRTDSLLVGQLNSTGIWIEILRRTDSGSRIPTPVEGVYEIRILNFPYILTASAKHKCGGNTKSHLMKIAVLF